MILNLLRVCQGVPERIIQLIGVVMDVVLIQSCKSEVLHLAVCHIVLLLGGS